MRTIQTNVYTYDELSDKAKEKARDWFRQGPDEFWSEYIIEDFMEAAKACGFKMDAKHVYWEGFSHQGSGASFDATWQASAVDVAPLLADRPTDTTLHGIAERFAALAAREPTGYGSTKASHLYMTMTRTWDCEWPDRDDGTFAELCADLADWLYRSLEREYAYQNSDDVVAENIRANEYEFTADGERARV